MYDVTNMANAKREVRLTNETMMNRLISLLNESGVSKVKDTYDLGKGTEFDDGYYYVSFVCTGKTFITLLKAFTILREEGTCEVEYESANGWDWKVA